MGIAERREREKSERRRAILNCARELILLQGIERVSMENIAKKAELSKATLYLHFQGKEIIFNEICEESARIFLDQFKPLSENGASGIQALKGFWRTYTELFGNSDEMIIVFKVRSFLNPGLPFISMEERSKSPFVDAIIAALKGIINQCKAEGIFDPGLDLVMATRLLLMMFSNTIDNATSISVEKRKSPEFFMEMTQAFQIIIYGFAKEGVSRSCLDITK
jgi:AcrR family transcriptional regulator